MASILADPPCMQCLTGIELHCSKSCLDQLAREIMAYIGLAHTEFK